MSMQAIVLAGERPGGSALAQAFELSSSILVDVAGKPSVVRVIDTLRQSRHIGGGVLCGPDAENAQDQTVQDLLAPGDFRWLAPLGGPAQSAIHALGEITGQPTLLTAADHALLTPDIVNGFCDLALLTDADFVVGFVPYSVVREAYPGSKRTVLKFADRQYCGSNLYLIRSERGVRLLEFWREIQQHRKKPWRIATAVGLGTLLSYLLGRLTIAAALSAIGDRAGCQVAHVELLSARAAVDVDSIADHTLAEQILAAC